MTIYVDKLRQWPGKGEWCHMITDGELGELHEFAAKIGLKRHWFQRRGHPHYDLRPGKRLQAIRAGAIPVDDRDYFKVIWAKRAEAENERTG